ncbi:glycosyltransferase family 2 protein [candidate division TA06 bacterium]|uniref:Glycosyltransferase family 2 protein n=1 Tax=candidate division TA06 bacterium TaxID=2250710 RepID=A0A933IAX9_UNCT6|nr:glycosyltransferase family 2 protein [candidate division TA06 bacterium]
MKSSISVVIPNYNGRELLASNLPALYDALQTSGIDDFEIIVSDDASIDDSVEYIKKNYPGVILIENPVNRGFSGNTNIGIKRAGKELVFLLNSDVMLTEKYFTPLVRYFEDDDTFGVMGRIIGLDSDKIQDGAKYPGYSYADINSNTNYICRIPTRGKTFSFFLSGANALIDRSKLEFLGGFDEIFGPYYSEDADLGLRAWRAGYRCYYEHDAVCKHPNATIIKKEKSGKVKVIAKRNKMLLHFIHLNNFELLFYLLALAVKLLFRTLWLDLNYCKSFFLFAVSIPKAVESKAKFKKLQKRNNVNLSVRNIAGFIKSNISRNNVEIF